MAKISNQAEVLKRFNLEYGDLLELSKTVRSGDVGNNESTAARLYFARLLDDATRRKPMWHNSALNYGYAFARTCLARSIASRGLISMLGINHRSELNQYNLADDLIESVRPVVDHYILTVVAPHRLGNTEDSNLSKEDRNIIFDILNYYAIIGNKKFALKDVCDKIVESFLTAILEDNVEKLELPKLAE